MASSPPLSEPRLVIPERVARRDKPLLWWAALLAVLALGYFAYRVFWQKARPSAVYRTEVVARRDIRRTTEAVGTLDVAQRVLVPAVTEGQLVEILVRPGDSVVRGQALAHLDENAAQRDVASAETSLGVSSARLEQARAALSAASEERKRTERLLARGLASESAMNAARAAEAEARARVQGAEAERQLSNQGLKGAQQ